MQKITVNGDKEFEFEENFSPDWDLIEMKEGEFHIIKDEKSYSATLISHNADEKSMVIRVNNQDYELQVKDKYDLLLERLGMDDMAANKLNEIKAPMPGLVLDIQVKPGDVLEKGSPVLVLEAMKMENVLKSPGEGRVKEVVVNKGQAVEKNQVLIELE